MMCLNALVAVFGLMLCLHTVFTMTSFCSSQNKQTALTLRLEKDNFDTPDEKVKWELERKQWWEMVYAVVWDLALVLLFVVQHRFMASQWWKDLLTEIGVVTAQRALYVLATCYTLLYVMTRFEPVRGSPLWYIDTSQQTLLWLLFTAVHVIAWILLYGTSLVMDLPEMVGIKQVYYEYLEVDPPMFHKSAPTRRLYGHMRHGGASCLMIVLWAHPMMTLTRLILATTLTLFMICGFAVHEADYVYLREQIARKRITLRFQRNKTVELLQ